MQQVSNLDHLNPEILLMSHFFVPTCFHHHQVHQEIFAVNSLRVQHILKTGILRSRNILAAFMGLTLQGDRPYEL